MKTVLILTENDSDNSRTQCWSAKLYINTTYYVFHTLRILVYILSITPCWLPRNIK